MRKLYLLALIAAVIAAMLTTSLALADHSPGQACEHPGKQGVNRSTPGDNPMCPGHGGPG